MTKQINDEMMQIRLKAEADLETFIRLVAPRRVLADFHLEMINWWTKADAKSHQLTLVPRDHGKSALIAYRVAWWITKYPDVRILYISATSKLAQKQLKFIQDILTSSVYRRYWPEMVNEGEFDREKWTTSEIAVDHPKRKLEAVRDPTVFTAGLTTSITGLHCDIAVMDDVVVKENAYTKDGRDKVKQQYSLLSSIEGATAQEWVVGTRYHPEDLYQTMLDMKEERYDANFELESFEPVFEVYQRQVEANGDGTGAFLWPIQMRKDGKVFGFSQQILAKKKAQYREAGSMREFYAQYYNDPSKGDSGAIKKEKFQYYNRKFLAKKGGLWYYNGRRLNVFAAIDFAFSLKRQSDYTAIVVIGIDSDHNIYILDIIRFKTDNILDYYEAVKDAFIKWDFRKLRAEVTSAQSVIVKELKENYIKRYGLSLSIEEYKPTRYDGSKEERIEAVLSPRYDNMQIWHYEDGNTIELEEELTSSNPRHDDIKDALASAVQKAVPPSERFVESQPETNVVFHPRFGGCY